MTYTELGEAEAEERVETLLRVAADLTERSPKSRRRWRWVAVLWIAALFPLVIGVERVSSRISARSHRPSRVAPGASDSTNAAATTSSESATTTTATTSPSSSPSSGPSSSPSSSAVTVTAVASLDALVVSTTVAPTAPATDVTTIVEPAPADAAPDTAPADEAPPDEAPPDTTRPPRRTPPRTTAPPAPATTAPPQPTPAPATTPPPPPPTDPPTAPPTDPPPTNPPPPAFAVRPDTFTVPSSGGTVHPLANDSGVSPSSLRVSGVPGDVSASTDGNGGIVVSAGQSAQGAQRAVYYSVCDAAGSHCATARMTITFT